MDQAKSKITSHHGENSLEASSGISTFERDTVQSWADELTKTFQTNRFSRYLQPRSVESPRDLHLAVDLGDVSLLDGMGHLLSFDTSPGREVSTVLSQVHNPRPADLAPHHDDLEASHGLTSSLTHDLSDDTEDDIGEADDIDDYYLFRSDEEDAQVDIPRENPASLSVEIVPVPSAEKDNGRAPSSRSLQTGVGPPWNNDPVPAEPNYTVKPSQSASLSLNSKRGGDHPMTLTMLQDTGDPGYKVKRRLIGRDWHERVQSVFIFPTQETAIAPQDRHRPTSLLGVGDTWSVLRERYLQEMTQGLADDREGDSETEIILEDLELGFGPGPIVLNSPRSNPVQSGYLPEFPKDDTKNSQRGRTLEKFDHHSLSSTNAKTFSLDPSVTEFAPARSISEQASKIGANCDDEVIAGHNRTCSSEDSRAKRRAYRLALQYLYGQTMIDPKTLLPLASMDVKSSGRDVALTLNPSFPPPSGLEVKTIIANGEILREYLAQMSGRDMSQASHAAPVDWKPPPVVDNQLEVDFNELSNAKSEILAIQARALTRESGGGGKSEAARLEKAGVDISKI